MSEIRSDETSPKCCEHERNFRIALETIDSFEPVIAAARLVAHEVDVMFSGGGDGGLEKCHECELGPIGFLRDAMNQLRPLLEALPATRSHPSEDACLHTVSIDTLPPFCGQCGIEDPWSNAPRTRGSEPEAGDPPVGSRLWRCEQELAKARVELTRLHWMRDIVGVDIERMFARALKEKDGREQQPNGSSFRPASGYDAGLASAERIVRSLGLHYKRRGQDEIAFALYDAADHVGSGVFTHPQQRAESGDRDPSSPDAVEVLREALERPCPVTSDRFFMTIKHPDLGWLPTYGGPYDSYGPVERDARTGDLYRWKYDHDQGGWTEMVAIELRIVSDEDDEALPASTMSLADAIEEMLAQSIDDYDVCRICRGKDGGGKGHEDNCAVLFLVAARDAEPAVQSEAEYDRDVYRDALAAIAEIERHAWRCSYCRHYADVYNEACAACGKAGGYSGSHDRDLTACYRQMRERALTALGTNQTSEGGRTPDVSLRRETPLSLAGRGSAEPAPFGDRREGPEADPVSVVDEAFRGTSWVHQDTPRACGWCWRVLPEHEPDCESAELAALRKVAEAAKSVDRAQWQSTAERHAAMFALADALEGLSKVKRARPSSSGGEK